MINILYLHTTSNTPLKVFTCSVSSYSIPGEYIRSGIMVVLYFEYIESRREETGLLPMR